MINHIADFSVIGILVFVILALVVRMLWQHWKKGPSEKASEVVAEQTNVNDRLRQVIQGHIGELHTTARARFIQALDIRLRPSEDEQEAVFSPWIEQFEAKAAELTAVKLEELLAYCNSEQIYFDNVGRLKRLITPMLNEAFSRLIAECVPVHESVAPAPVE